MVLLSSRYPLCSCSRLSSEIEGAVATSRRCCSSSTCRRRSKGQAADALVAEARDRFIGLAGELDGADRKRVNHNQDHGYGAVKLRGDAWAREPQSDQHMSSERSCRGRTAVRQRTTGGILLRDTD